MIHIIFCAYDMSFKISMPLTIYILRAVDPKYREMTKNFITQEKVRKDKWGPYFVEIARRTVDAAKDHDKVVLSHATYKEEARDVVIEKIVEGGVPRDHITVIELTIDPIVKARGLYYRSKRQCEQYGISMEDACKGHIEWEGDKLTEEKFIKAVVPEGGNPNPGYEDCPIAKKADVSGRDISHCDNVDKALELTRSLDWTYESICAKVFPLDKERDAEWVATGSMEEFQKISAEVATNPAIKDDAKDTEEVKELKKKRRSTLIAAKSWREMSDFGKLALEDDE